MELGEFRNRVALQTLGGSIDAAGAFGVIPHSKKFGYLVIEPNKGDTSVNSPLASLLSWGEGWHNYHHTIVKDYRHGYKWWEIDPPAWFIEKLFLGKG